MMMVRLSGLEGSVSGILYPEFIGISQTTSVLIESKRRSPEETKDEIIRRELSPPTVAAMHPMQIPATSPLEVLDLGQGVNFVVGEMLYLSLPKTGRTTKSLDATAVVASNGILMNGVLYPLSRGFLGKAMQVVQIANDHVNSEGRPISLSAWRQWRVRRNGQFIRLFDLKDPALAHVRAERSVALSLDDLGL